MGKPSEPCEPHTTILTEAAGCLSVSGLMGLSQVKTCIPVSLQLQLVMITPLDHLWLFSVGLLTEIDMFFRLLF